MSSRRRALAPPAQDSPARRGARGPTARLPPAASGDGRRSAPDSDRPGCPAPSLRSTTHCWPRPPQRPSSPRRPSPHLQALGSSAGADPPVSLGAVVLLPLKSGVGFAPGPGTNRARPRCGDADCPPSETAAPPPPRPLVAPPAWETPKRYRRDAVTWVQEIEGSAGKHRILLCVSAEGRYRPGGPRRKLPVDLLKQTNRLGILVDHRQRAAISELLLASVEGKR